MASTELNRVADGDPAEQDRRHVGPDVQVGRWLTPMPSTGRGLTLTDMEVPPTTTKANNGKAVTVLATVVAVAAAYLLIELLEALPGDRDTIVATVAIAGSIAGLVLSVVAIWSTRGAQRRAAVAGVACLVIAGVAFLAVLVPDMSTFDRTMYPVLGAGSALLGVLIIVGAYRGLLGMSGWFRDNDDRG